MSNHEVALLRGAKVTIDKSEDDDKIVVFIDTSEEEALPSGSPGIRVWLNDALMYSDGRVGHDPVTDEPGAAEALINRVHQLALRRADHMEIVREVNRFLGL